MIIFECIDFGILFAPDYPSSCCGSNNVSRPFIDYDLGNVHLGQSSPVISNLKEKNAILVQPFTVNKNLTRHNNCSDCKWIMILVTFGKKINKTPVLKYHIDIL